MLNREVFNFDRTWRALLAGVLGLILGLGAASVVGEITDNTLLGPYALLDSATDNGDGKIRIEWSLQQAEEHQVFQNSHPDKVCVYWVEVGSGEEHTNTCFTSEISNEDDLLIATGIGEGTTADYDVLLLTYYSDIRIGGPVQQAVVSVSG